MSDTEDSLNAFLEATNDDDESVHLRKPSRDDYGGGMMGRSAGMGASGSMGRSGYGAGSSYGGMAGMGMGMGMGMGGTYGAGFGYGKSNLGGDPLANIDLDALGAQQRQHMMERGSKQAPPRQPAKAAPAKRSCNIDVPGPLPSELAARQKSKEVSQRSKDPSPPARRSSKTKSKESSSSSSGGSDMESTPQEGGEGGGMASMFASFQKEMQQLKDSAEELRKKEAEEAAEREKREEEEKRRREEREKHEEEEKRRREQERKLAEEKRLREEEEAKRRKEEEDARKKAEEETKKKAEEEAKKKKEEEDRVKREEEEKKKKEREQAEEEERRKKHEEDARRSAAVAEEGRKQEEAQAKSQEELKKLHEEQRRQSEDEEQQKKQEDLKRMHEEQQRKQEADEEEEKRKKQEELKKIYEQQQRKNSEEQAGEETRKKQEELKAIHEEQQRKKAQEEEEEEKRKKQEELKQLHEEQQRKKAEEQEEEERRKKQEELKAIYEEQQRKKAKEEEDKCKKQEELKQLHEEQQRRKAEEQAEEERRKKQEELKQLHEEHLRRKAEEDQRQKIALEEAAAKHEEGQGSHIDGSRSAAVDVPQSRDSQRIPATMELFSHRGPCGTEAMQQRGNSGQAELQFSPPLNATAASIGSLPLMASVVRGQGDQAEPAQQAGMAPPAQPPTHAEDDRWRLNCTDGKLLVLRSTDSAEEEERNAYWRARGLGLADSGRFTRTLDATSVLLGSMVGGDAQQAVATAGASSRRPLRTGTLSPDELRAELEAASALASQGAGFAAGLGHLRASAAERAQLEALQAELRTLHQKIALLEEYNADLAAAKSHAETEVEQLNAQVMRWRLECSKLEDAVAAGTSALKEKDVVLKDVKKQLEAVQNDFAKRSMQDADDAAKAIADRDELAAHVAQIEAELVGLREERETLHQDLAVASRLSLGEHVEPTKFAGSGAEEALRLRMELEAAEGMVRGYEKENENLMQQNRQLRQTARLKREEVDGRQLQLVAELNAARASADANPASMRRVADLERDLVIAKERADEHARELERCREMKRQLERELLNGAPVVVDEHAPSKQQLSEALAAQSRAEQEVSELRDKLQWYAKSQCEMEDDRREVERLDEEVRTLRVENSELRRRPSAKEANRRVAEMRKQIDELSECLRKRNPDSILSLVKACEPPPEERRELRELRGRVTELEAKLSDRDTMYDRRVRALRAQYDQLRHEYERRSGGEDAGAMQGGSGATGQAGVGGPAPDREAVLVARIKDLERQVEHTKSYYLTKLRKREPLVPPKQPARSNANGVAQQREAELQLGIRDRDVQIEDLKRKVASLETRMVDQPGDGTPDPVALSSAAAPAPALLRLFLASPEMQPLAMLSIELRAMTHAARCHRYDEVACQARALLSVLSAEETAAGAFQRGFAPIAHGASQACQDALRLKAQPPLPGAIWRLWRTLATQVATVAAEAGLRGDGCLSSREGTASDVAAAMTALRACIEAVLCGLVFSQGGRSGCDGQGAREAWRSELSANIESLLPRLLLEHLREEIDTVGISHAGIILQDAEVHAGLDHRLPWVEFVGVLNRCGIGSVGLLAESKRVADPHWSLAVGELRQLFCTEQRSHVPESPCAGLVRTLVRIRLVAANHKPPLPAMFRQLDDSGRGFVQRSEFMEVLGSIHCALSLEERAQLAAFFSPASDPRWVCYPLLLQSVVPTPDEANFGGTSSAQSAAGLPDGMPSARWAEFVHTPMAALAHPRSQSLVVGQPGALGRATELEAENGELRERIRVLEGRCAEQADLLARTPAQAVRQLQGEVAALESRVVEQQTAASTAARKLEITLRGELEVSQHEAAALKRSLQAKDREVERYKRELEDIIAELTKLQGAHGIAQ
eukprot:CAMPEP_0115184930 /NCGR_PEP_ID=MMETSP0270-20121206/9211_1 /TAXON_ID=71861 /ORGANISM="Scrippsiella trochoidea, Strain CCMP3099" /LENGTH=1881 /DNA_ID=CAMNT_0002598021 /DNA_START=98 /DNA_END=5743 /DNA_ORIENTATION=-